MNPNIPHRSRHGELLTERSRSLRRNTTFPERKLWQELRNRQWQGRKFRRQLVIGEFICDFACIEAKLVVELDGPSHDGSDQYDQERTAYLESEGWRVIRFTNKEVQQHTESVLKRIAAAVGD